jgi:hypothetical protein
MIQSRIDDPIQPAYDRMLESISTFLPKSALEATLTAFWPRVGAGWQGDLMVVGRAVNGWETAGWPAADAADATWREERIRQLRSLRPEEEGDPMRWVSQTWGRALSRAAGQTYSTPGSAFWRVIHRVAEGVGLGRDKPEDWPSKLVHSNLYKVAPWLEGGPATSASGGNPSARLQHCQRDSAAKLLRDEISSFKPVRLLLLTGLDWAAPFLPVLGASKSTITEDHPGVVEWTGALSIPGATCLTVVTPHPQGVPGGEETFAADILRAFAAA